jgi:SET domain-containing protein
MQPITRKVTTRVPDRDFIRVGRSRIEGKGVFAKRKIPRGSRIIEYIGTRVPVAKLFAAVPGDGKPAAVYAFRLNDTTVIDGARGGNDSRFINHSVIRTARRTVSTITGMCTPCVTSRAAKN